MLLSKPPLPPVFFLPPFPLSLIAYPYTYLTLLFPLFKFLPRVVKRILPEAAEEWGKDEQVCWPTALHPPHAARGHRPRCWVGHRSRWPEENNGSKAFELVVNPLSVQQLLRSARSVEVTWLWGQKNGEPLAMAVTKLPGPGSWSLIVSCVLCPSNWHQASALWLIVDGFFFL